MNSLAILRTCRDNRHRVARGHTRRGLAASRRAGMRPERGATASRNRPAAHYEGHDPELCTR